MDLDAIGDLPMPVTYGRHLTRLFEPTALLAGTGLVPADLERPGATLRVRQALTYIDNAIKLSPRGEWYLEWAASLSDHFHGPISLALMSAPTLGESLDAFIAYFPARVPYLHLQGRHDGERFHAEMRALIDLGAGRALLMETPLLILERYLIDVYLIDPAEARVHLDYPPTPYAEHYPRYFKCGVRFDAEHTALVIPAAWRAIPNLGYTAATWAHARQQCEGLLGASVERDTLGQLHSYLAAALDIADRPRALPTLTEAAAHLFLTPRTLIRRLRRLGTSYQSLTDALLREHACELLANEQLKIKEVAAKLGFDNPANFGKAFKRWTGQSPGGYREASRHRVR
jgi:AraC-like DNA-binding protein